MIADESGGRDPLGIVNEDPLRIVNEDLVRIADEARVVTPAVPAVRRAPRPDWLKVRLPNSPRYFELKALVARERLNTVCEDARCPNIGECWGAGTATFMILGDVCTRACGFCAVK